MQISFAVLSVQCRQNTDIGRSAGNAKVALGVVFNVCFIGKMALKRVLREQVVTMWTGLKSESGLWFWVTSVEYPGIITRVLTGRGNSERL
jgi:hypothetical protein